MEPRAQERLNDLYDYWMPFVDDTTCYPIDCVFTAEELDTIDRYRVDFEGFVAEQEAAWLRDGGITDETWAAYKENLNSYGMDKLLEPTRAPTTAMPRPLRLLNNTAIHKASVRPGAGFSRSVRLAAGAVPGTPNRKELPLCPTT